MHPLLWRTPFLLKILPRWKTEQEIVILKHTLNLTFPEARKQIQQKTNISYASVATKSYKSSTRYPCHHIIFPQLKPQQPLNQSLKQILKQNLRQNTKLLQLIYRPQNLHQKNKHLHIDHAHIKDKETPLHRHLNILHQFLITSVS